MGTNEVERQRWNDPSWTAAWPRRERLTSNVTGYLLEHLRPAEGERVLDVGSGGGGTTLAIAEAVGTGSVVGADISGPLCALATGRAAEAGVGNVTFVVADAQSDAIDGGPFDAATSQFGVMFFDEPVRAFGNIRTHLAPGGRLAFACWQVAERNPWLPMRALAPFVAPPPPPEAGRHPTGPCSLGDAEATAALLAAAGWAEIGWQPYELVVTVERDAIGDDDQLRHMGIAEDELPRARAAVDAQLRPFERPDGHYEAPLAFQVFTARA